jgi:PAS domain S-box-containing protein
MSDPIEGESDGPGQVVERYRTLVEASSDLIAIVDSDGTITYANGAVETILGYDPDEVIGETGDEYAHPKDRDSVTETFEAVRSGVDESRTVEFRARCVDGSWCWIEATMQNLLDDVGGIVVNGRDITERTERERELATTKERMELALEGANLGIWDWDMQTDEVSRDELLTEMLGYTQSEMGDRMHGWEEIVHPGDEKRHNEALSHHISNWTPYYQCDHRLRTKSGDWKWVRTTGKVVNRDENGSPTRAVGIHQDIDDRKRTELALEEERDMFANGPAIVFNWDDADGWPIEYVSTNVEDVLGYTPAELQSGDVLFADLIHEDDLDQVARQVAEHDEAGAEHMSLDPYRVLTAEGDVRWVMEHTRYVDDGGDGSHLLGYLIDITERKRRERELEKREQKYRHLFEDTRDALMVFDREGYLDCNERALELFGIDSVDGFLEYTPWELSPSEQPDGRDSQEAALKHVEAAFQEGEAFFEWTHQRADGTTFPAEVKLSRFEYDGDPALHAMVRDITERKEYEHAIEQARQELRQVIDLIPDPIFVENRDDELLLTNEANAELVGSTREEIEGKLESELFPDTDHYEKRRQRDLDVMDSGESMVCKERVTTTEGEMRIFQTTRIPFDTAKTDGDAVLGYARDVTALKEYERELEEQRDNLEILNQVVRHDIRNKLQLVLAYADILRTESEAADGEYVEKVLKAAHEAVDITTTARDVTEVMLQSDVDYHPVRLRVALEDEIEDVRSNYNSALVRIDGPLPDARVRADDMLASVIRNLLTNAIQHNDKDIPEITVSATRVDGSVLVRIADNGPGIPDDRKEGIFEQGEMGLDSEGTGLGLYLVDTLVGRYGGEVRVKDNNPDGAVFSVELPIAD